MLIQDNTQMVNAVDGYWFAGKLTSSALGVFTIDIYTNKDITRHIVSMLSGEEAEQNIPVSISKSYLWVPEENTFRISGATLKLDTGLIVEYPICKVDYLIFVSKTELISQEDYEGAQPLSVIEENLINPRI